MSLICFILIFAVLLAYITGHIFILFGKDNKRLSLKEIINNLPAKITFFNPIEGKWETLNWNHRTMHAHSNSLVTNNSYVPHPSTHSFWWIVFETDKNVYCLVFNDYLPAKEQLDKLTPIRVYELDQRKITGDSYTQIINKLTKDLSYTVF